MWTLTAYAQAGPDVSVIDFVRVNDGKSAEAVYFYENNWLVYRELALKKGFIRSYRMWKAKAEASADFDLLLGTEFADAEQLKLSEERFNAIIRETNPAGPKLLNNVPPAEFRQTVFSKTVETVGAAGPQ